MVFLPLWLILFFFFFFFNDTATTEIYTLSLHDALPISLCGQGRLGRHLRHQDLGEPSGPCRRCRSEEHTSELQSQSNLVCRLLLEKKKTNNLDIVQQLQMQITNLRLSVILTLSAHLCID